MHAIKHLQMPEQLNHINVDSAWIDFMRKLLAIGRTAVLMKSIGAMSDYGKKKSDKLN